MQEKHYPSLTVHTSLLPFVLSLQKCLYSKDTHHIFMFFWLRLYNHVVKDPTHQQKTTKHCSVYSIVYNGMDSANIALFITFNHHMFVYAYFVIN